eukprot:CAMPEP_0170281656 /NCGR_PEP_ID=MMETSP0116_2-20130129/40848_1 /TAXON_ID=400756 /ORGANISM="Durinskia baltica, Strain CSIRO CS-38" /LENGTH=57 /DNA_ID=CAMNT_0010532999 /DNA_START=221 /DNA_END=391 /DNA_ORIENTATION=-
MPEATAEATRLLVSNTRRAAVCQGAAAQNQYKSRGSAECGGYMPRVLKSTSPRLRLL